MASPDSSTTPLLRTYLDSGLPENSADFTTVIVIHGYGFHAGNFKKLLPLAPEYNARIVGVNRRDYPGAAPFTPEERATLARLAATPARSPDAVAGTEQAMKARARELYDYLVDFVRTERVTRPRGDGTGGIVLAGWSLGAVWISALLTHVAEFPAGDVRVAEYVRRIVFYDASFICFGYAQPKELYHPLHDPLLSPEERLERFNLWVAGYFAHGEVSEAGPSALESRNALKIPAPTVTTMSAEELAESTYAPPGQPGGSEALLIEACIAHGTYATLKEGAFYLRELPPGKDDWRGVAVRYLWSDSSIWEMPFGWWTLSRELDEARKAGKAVRDMEYVRFRGANHFAHWDFPDRTLRGFLGDDGEIA